MRRYHHYSKPLTEAGRKIFKVIGLLFLSFAGLLFLAGSFCLVNWLMLGNDEFEVASLVVGFIFIVFSFLGTIFTIIAKYGKSKAYIVENDEIM